MAVDYEPSERPPGRIHQPSVRPPGVVHPLSLRQPVENHKDVMCTDCHFPIKTPQNQYKFSTYCTCTAATAGSTIWPLHPEEYEGAWNLYMSEQQTQSSKPIKHDKGLENITGTSSKEYFEADISKKKLDVDYIKGKNSCDDRIRMRYVEGSTGEIVNIDIFPKKEVCGKPPGTPVVVVDRQPSGRRPPGGVRPSGGQPLPRRSLPENEFGDVICNVCHYPIRTVRSLYRYTVYCSCGSTRMETNGIVSDRCV